VKRYHREIGTDWVRSVCAPRTHSVIYLSQIAQVEVVAALRRAGRLESMHPSSVEALVSHFKRHLAHANYHLVPVATTVIAFAAELCNKYWDVDTSPLRSLDAIHLASALPIVSGSVDELVFVTADTRLAAIAAFEGFRFINPAYPPRAI
jgi:hypothetical protein